MNLSQARVAILGTGNMGEAILAGALRAGVAPDQLICSTLDESRLEFLRSTYGVQVTGDSADAASKADIVVAAVKPQDMDALLGAVAGSLKPGAIVVSVAVGLDLAWLAARLPAGTPIVRIMPNTPAAVGAGVSVMSCGAQVTLDDAGLVRAIFEGAGDVVDIPEKLQAAAGAVSGSGPAYVFAMIDALAEAAVKQGIPRNLAVRLAVGTVGGSARLLAETGEHPALARERVSSPGGTTIAGLHALDAAGVRAAYVAAVEAAVARTHELAAQLG
ncbi:MAG: pyrroline-5-carboxylate reductase [Cellulomonadaceae bacterium]|jgi:pyrroline-5-carboxylate reductase|nr:pyrroline-5-carboxylate reductase [Cellulomonadaceae bacterium]